MSEAVRRAAEFLSEERAFRLGDLPTESFHPKTMNLSQTAQGDLAGAIRMLQSVDAEIPPVVEKVLAGGVFGELVESFVRAASAGRRIYFTGCGSTGRLSILLEAAWRRFWRELGEGQPEVSALAGGMEQLACSVMAGGDFALIKAVEGFEDFPDFGRYQLRRAGVGPGDVVTAITEGGETPFVIGTAWEGLDAGAEVFFVYNNPTGLLAKHVQRSREVIEERRIRKLDLATGPMAITGSTRMQATTAELLVVGAALETAIVRILKERLGAVQCKGPGPNLREAADYHGLFVGLLRELSRAEAVDAMARLTRYEEDIYRVGGLVTYAADSVLLDVLTDTTERSPTFMIPPFRRIDDTLSPRSWAFVKNPLRSTGKAWRALLEREPRGLDWGPEIYAKLNAPERLRVNAPKLDNEQIYKFRIGGEPGASRTDAPDSALVPIGIGAEAGLLLDAAAEMFGAGYGSTAVITIGGRAEAADVDEQFEFDCGLVDSPLRLWEHLAVKLVLNTISTATMVRLGRVLGNAMVWLSPSNKKLIDRGSRLVAHTTGCGYERACVELHKAMDEVEWLSARGEQAPSPVALAIERIESQGG